MRRLDTRDSGFEADFVALLAAKRESAPDVAAAVAAVIAEVRSHGDAALIGLTERFDGHALGRGQIRLGVDEIEAGAEAADTEALPALALAANRIRAYHERQMPEDVWYRDTQGVELGSRWTPVAAAGLYVPGGLAAYPSSLLMNAIPAQVAGVARIAVCVPAPSGVISPLVLAAARLLELDEIYRIGGAQAIAALAYGTETIAAVDKVVGPGNAYVAAAKKQVFGDVGIDMIAGPSEILVIADNENDPRWIAADLLSQAEHDVAAQALLITDDAAFADAVVAAVDAHLEELPRAALARESWDTFGAVILVADMKDAPALSDRIAPEHLELAVAEPEAVLAQVHHAGAVFLGRHTPEAIGDYVAGPNHVLPTARTARFASGLSVIDFLKRTSIIGCDAQSLARIGPAAVQLATAESLDAHALSVSLRLSR